MIKNENLEYSLVLQTYSQLSNIYDCEILFDSYQYVKQSYGQLKEIYGNIQNLGNNDSSIFFKF